MAYRRAGRRYWVLFGALVAAAWVLVAAAVWPFLRGP